VVWHASKDFVADVQVVDGGTDGYNGPGCIMAEDDRKSVDRSVLLILCVLGAGLRGKLE
jgi:hypothetical protein